MFQAVEAQPDGRWIGPSAPDGVMRIHAFRQVVDRDLEVVVGFDKSDALAASAAWERGAVIFAVGITLFITMAAWGLLREMRAARTREEVLARDRAILESSNVQLEMARARADAKTAQLQATLAGMSDGVSMLDRDLRLVQWNDHFADYTGVPAAMLRVGLPMEDIVRAQAELGEFGPVDVEAEVSRRMALLRAQSQVGTIERSRPDGRILELRRSALPGGGYVTLYADITARKQAEDALRRARELAEAATEAKSRFVAIVSHEIRTPLNTLLNSLALLADTPMSTGQHRMVDMAAQSGEALLALINDILEMSRMEAGRLGLRPSTFALRPLLEGVVEMFRAPAQERGLSVSLSLAPGVPDRLYADPGRMRQVLMNLMSNAAKFSSPGEVVLLAGTTFAGGRTMLRLAVRDPGPAIKPADRAMLFQPFSRLEQSDSAGKPGSGLGLAICQRLVSLMGGEISCSVTEAGGNEFWLTLPIEPIPAQAPASPRRAGPGLRGRAPRSRILLVEDIPANQLITATLLRREGHMVDVAGSGQQAIEAVARAPYDLVFMDIFMPGMTGLEATRRIRALSGPSRSTPVVALTANVSAEDWARCLDAGMDGMLSKPVEVAKLGDALMEHVWMGGPRTGRPAEQPAQRPAAQTAAAPAEPAPSAPPVPPAPERVEPEVPVLAVDRLAELRDNLPPATLASLIEQCLGEMHERMERMQGSLGGDDLSRIGQEAHALAGMAGSYAMASLDARLRRIMRAAAESDMDGVRLAATDLCSDFERAEEALRAAMRTELV
jgi:signal transduction histidine kinase/DNA-binding NarL/FixJ family response regulator/HPt (histidine-containing phosphotransfer) domain-containing protein